MDLNTIIDEAYEVKHMYDELKQRKGWNAWGAAEFTQGLVGDVGDLMKLVMAKNNLRGAENLDSRLAHELSDCLWSILVISRELGIDLEKEFMQTMAELKKRVTIGK